MPQNPTPAQPTTPSVDPKAPVTPSVPATPVQPAGPGPKPPAPSVPPASPTPTAGPVSGGNVPPQVKPLQPQPLPKSVAVGPALTGTPVAKPVAPAPASVPATKPVAPPARPVAPAPKPPVQPAAVPVKPAPMPAPAPKPPQAQATVVPKAPTPAPKQTPVQPAGPGPKPPVLSGQPAPAAKPPVPPAPLARPVAQAPKPAPAQNPAPAKSAADGDVTLPPPSKIQKMPPPTPAPKPVAASAKPMPAKDSGKDLPPPPAPTASTPAPKASPGTPPATLPAAPPKTPSGSGPTLPAPAPAAGGSTPPPAAAGKPPAGAKAQMAELKKSPLRFLPFILGGFLILGLIFFIFSRLFGGRSTPTPTTPRTNGTGTQQTGGGTVTITYWGLWEPSGVIQEVISDFEAKNPKIKVNYQQQSYNDYRERLQTAIVSGRGPDIFRFHASWTPMLIQELSPAPTSVFPDTEFANTFYPIAVDQLTLNDRAVGVPLMYDGLALYYNTEVLRTANVQPPTTWAEVKELASRLTIRSGAKIERAGMAIGNASNVEHFSDILGLLMLQNGADPRKPSAQAAQDALLFYTNFVKVDRVWDNTLPSSTVAFARGDVAMMLAPSWRAHEIQALNPNLKFGIAPVPQLAGKKVTWATYWAEGVSAQSKYKNEAWTFLKYLSSEETLRKFYSEASKVRGFGEIYSRRDMANDLANDPMLGAFVSDAPDARNWYMNSFTHDNGLNDLLIKYYEDAINAVLESGEPKTALETVEQGSNQILRQYGIPTTSSTVTTQ